MKIFKDPLKIIAINTTIFILGCLFFGCLALYAIITERGQENPIRTEHLQQHADDHEKYDKMIKLLDELNQKIDTIISE